MSWVAKSFAKWIEKTPPMQKSMAVFLFVRFEPLLPSQ